MLWWRPRGPHGRHRLGQADVISSYPLLMSALEPLAQLRAATVASPNVGLHPIDVAVADAPVYPTRRARRSVGPFHPRDGPRTRTAARQPRWADPEDQAGRDRLVVAVVAGTATLGDLMTGSSACSTFGATSAVGARERRPCEASAAPASLSRLLLDDVPSVLAQCPPNGAAPKGREVDVRLNAIVADHGYSGREDPGAQSNGFHTRSTDINEHSEPPDSKAVLIEIEMAERVRSAEAKSRSSANSSAELRHRPGRLLRLIAKLLRHRSPRRRTARCALV